MIFLLDSIIHTYILITFIPIIHWKKLLYETQWTYGLLSRILNYDIMTQYGYIYLSKCDISCYITTVKLDIITNRRLGTYFKVMLFVICYRYNEEKHNCFSFIMAFIKLFNSFKPSSHCIETREDFTELFIAPVTIKAHKYIYLYRQIIENGFYVYNQSSKEILVS